ncbi:MAG: S-layer homology domain-containing protein [Candidatus Margulisiibacteriota bacterium]
MKKKLIVLLGLLLLCQTVVLAAAANDPVTIGSSARILGMGRAFVGLADDSSALFINPAGLIQLENGMFNSMLGKHINEYNQVVLGGAMPFDFGSLGLGFTSYSISVSVPSFESTGGLPPILNGQSNYTYGIKTYLISYAKKLDFILNNLSAGATLKLYQGDLSGSTISALTASGMDLDLGLLYKVNKNLQAGIALQSILPSSMGGKLHWSDNTDESLPATVKSGISFKPLNNLSVGLDMDYFPTQAGIPTLFHIGGEWSPIVDMNWLRAFTLRGGIDQSSAGDKMYNNMSLGVGVKVDGFSFDYAYHTYSDFSQFSSHYISLSYGYPEKKKESKEKKEIFIINNPSFEVSYNEKLNVTGKIFSPDVKKVAVSQESVGIAADNSLNAQLPLKLGANFLDFTAMDVNDKPLKTIGIKVVRLKTFADLASDYWAKLPIEYLATLNIITGFPDETFKPENSVNRAEMCSLLIKAAGTKLASEVSKKFKDVPDNHWAVKFIETAADEQYVTGYPDKTFKPSRAITRAEGVSIIARFANFPISRVLEAPFSDIPGRHWAASSISAAKNAGLLDYLNGQPFEPNKPLTRGETAYILSRTDFAKSKIGDLLK